MPWIEATLRGQKVLARADEAGHLVADGGRVEIRYKPADGRAYRALAANLHVAEAAARFPDEHCASAEAAPSKEQSATSSAARSAAKKDAAKAAITPPDAQSFTVYADGACSGNPGPAGAGVVIVDPGGKIREGFRYLGEATNNVAELTAVLIALDATEGLGHPVRLHTDSQYTIGVLQKGWKAKANPELIATLRAKLAKRPDVRLFYVPGHAGVPLNERADELAREAVRTGLSREPR
jgi:ribonuclease HI